MSDILKEKFVKDCKAKGWELVNPCHINVFPEDEIFGEVCDVLGIDGGNEDLQEIKLLIIAKVETIITDEEE